MNKYIWQEKDWPHFRWDSTRILKLLGECHFRQGRLLGILRTLDAEVILRVQADALVKEAMATSEIEDVRLDPAAVRCSVARRFGLPDAGLPEPARAVDELVSMLLDASRNLGAPLDEERLFGWHAALFPAGRSGLKKIAVAQWRPGGAAMRVVSGPIGKERIHFEAPASDQVPHKMKEFFRWWEGTAMDLDCFLRASLAHIFFVTIHSFEDGNGRIARALTSLALAQGELTTAMSISLSAQLYAERQGYYKELEAAQRGSLDVTVWLEWHLRAIVSAFESAERATGRKRSFGTSGAV